MWLEKGKMRDEKEKKEGKKEKGGDTVKRINKNGTGRMLEY